MPFKNGDPMFGRRATRECRHCGATQYDWGNSGFGPEGSDSHYRSFFCYGEGGCGAMDTELMANDAYRVWSYSGHVRYPSSTPSLNG